MERASDELVERARRRDAAAFARLVEMHERAALSVAYAVVGEAEAAGDVVQDAFMKAWRCVGELREAGQFGPWMMRIVRNAALDYRRRGKGSGRVELNDAVVAGGGGPGEVAEQGEVSERIEAALRELDDVTRTVVVLRYYDGRSSREIGEAVGLSAAAVDVRLSRARGVLRQKLAAVGESKE